MASNVVGEVQVRVVPDGSGFGPELQALINKAANSANLNLGAATQATQQLGQAINNSLGQGFAQASVQAAGFTAAVLGTKAAVEGLLNKFAGMFDQLAQAQAGFNSIIGERAGGALLEEIRQFAKESPFVTQQLVNYSQQLLGVGLASEKIVPLLRDTGNVIASVGGDTNNLSRVLFTMTQIQTVGRLTGQDAMQLQSALIPITKMLASYLGKTTTEVKKMQEQGRISAETVFAAIQAAGQKVPGAMNNAVRTIAGARSVLSDTINILITNSKGLRGIYDDIVAGIQLFAAKLSEPKVAAAIDAALGKITEVYEALKPVIASFAEGLGKGGLTGLSAFTSVLQILASILESFPDWMLEAIGKGLAAIAMIKAPMMLIQYVDNLRRLTAIFSVTNNPLAGIKKLVSGMVASTAAATKAVTANNAQTASLKALGTQAQWTAKQVAAANAAGLGGYVPGGPLATGGGKGGRLSNLFANLSGEGKYADMARMASSIGLVMGGQYLANRKGNLNLGVATLGQEQTNALGTVATYAGMGAQFGPWGALAGAGVGMVKSIFDAQKAADEYRKKMQMEAGQFQAQTVIDTGTLRYGEGLDARKYELNMAGIAGYDRATERALRNVEYVNAKADALPTDELGLKESMRESAWNEYQIVLGISEAGKAALQAEIDANYAPVIERVQGLTKALSPELSAAFQKRVGTITGGLAGKVGYDLSDMTKLEDGLAEYGLTLEEVATTSQEELERIIKAFEGLDSAQQKAIVSATEYNANFEKAKGLAQGYYGAQVTQAKNRMQIFSAEKSAQEAAMKAYEDKNNKLLQLQAEAAVGEYKMAVFTKSFAEEMDRLRTKGGTDKEKEDKARDKALADSEQAAKRFQIVSKSTIDEMSKTYGYSQDQLKEILGLTDAISGNYKITITVEIEEALKKLQTLQAMLDKNLTMWAASVALGNEPPRQGFVNLGAKIAEQKRILNEAIAAQATPASGGGGGGSAGQTFEDKVKSAADSLESAVKSAMEAAESAASAWKSSIKERTQYEQAVSASAILSNTRRQITDITFLQSSIATLKARGLSEAAITALDISSITDVRQVKKLLSSDPTQLKAISDAVASRDKAASTISADRLQEQSRKTITQAIIEAAKLLGYTPTPEQARQIAATFNINPSTDPLTMVDQILANLSGGKLGV